MRERQWVRIIKRIAVVVIGYGLLVFALLITTIIRSELQIWGGSMALPAYAELESRAHLRTYVRNIFGDPLPYAVVQVGGRVVQADNTGFVEITNLRPGRYQMDVLAGGYQPFTLEVQLEEGNNSPVIKYDTGLWPEEFLVDFHIYYSSDQRLLGLTGFANGSNEPLYIVRASLLSPQGEVITDLLHENDGFAYYADFSSKIEVVNEPQKALKWPPKTWQPAEFPTIPGFFRAGLYTLEVHYGTLAEHEKGEYRIFQITDHLDYELTGNPHSTDLY